MRAPKCLSIAGSDPSGGAGIQSDLKTFSALGAYGMAAITALTVQNSTGVQRVEPVAAALVKQQIDAVLEDIEVDAIKIGMLATAENVRAAANCLANHPTIPVVLDPVLVSTSGARLLQPDAVQLMIAQLFPRATIVTPNRAEASEILGRTVSTINDSHEAAQQFIQLGAQAVLIKGGDSDTNRDVVTDIYCDGRNLQELHSPRVNTPHTRGTGCGLSSAICVELARGRALLDAVKLARAFVHDSLKCSLQVGTARGPVNVLKLQ